jgi:hypothetical protein
MFQDVCERAGLGRDWAPRDLRHTFVSLLSDDGMAIEKIARLAGHASSHVTETVYRQEELASAYQPLWELRAGHCRVLPLWFSSVRPSLLDLRRQFSNSSPTTKSLVKRLLQRVGKTGQVRTDPKFEDARGPDVRQLRCVQRRLSPAEVEALLADYDAGGWVGELAKVYGIHRTTVSAHVARAGKAGS